MKRILIVAYAFPPIAVAGAMRPLRFVKYLPKYGWESIVLTIRGRADLAKDPDLLNEIPAGAHIHRTTAWDPWVWNRLVKSQIERIQRGKTARLASISKNAEEDILESKFKGIKKLLKDVVSTPDHQIFWLPFAVAGGLRMFGRFKYDAILTTSPPASSHLVGLFLSKLTGRPWLADFRDPWMDHPLNDVLRRGRVRARVERWLERKVMTGASVIICNTPMNRERLLTAYPNLPSKKFVVIPNGFDRECIDSVKPACFNKITVAHTGIFYPHLDPYFFFEALSRWIEERKKERCFDDRFQVLLVGSGERVLENLLEHLNLTKYVRLMDRVTYRDAVAIAKGADALLVSLGFKEQAIGWVPLKLYDYLGCEKPILAFLPEDGQAAKIIISGNAGEVISTPDHKKVFEFLDRICGLNGNDNNRRLPHKDVFQKYEQASLTKDLAEILDDVILEAANQVEKGFLAGTH